MEQRLLLDFFIRRSDIKVENLDTIVTIEYLNEQGYLKGDGLDGVDLTEYATKTYVQDSLTDYVTQSDLGNSISGLATTDYVDNSLTGLATELYVTTELNNYVSNFTFNNVLVDLVTKDYLNDALGDLTIPTKVSQLDNDSHYLTEDDLEDIVISLDTDDIENKSSVFGNTLTEALDNLDNKIHQAGNNFLGVYNTLQDLTTAKAGTAIWGDFAYVGTIGSSIQQYIWDDFQQAFLKPVIHLDGGTITGEQK